MKAAIKFLLILYQKVSVVFMRPACRYYPSCSAYAREAVDRHGVAFGGFLALKRIIRCNQWFPGGDDPVP